MTEGLTEADRTALWQKVETRIDRLERLNEQLRQACRAGLPFVEQLAATGEPTTADQANEAAKRIRDALDAAEQEI